MPRNSVAEGGIRVAFGGNTDEKFLRSPLVSPLYGDYSGLPPVFLSASDTGVLLDDCRLLYEKLKAEKHRTALDIQHGVCHAFQVFAEMPEARRTLQRAFDFLEDCG